MMIKFSQISFIINKIRAMHKIHAMTQSQDTFSLKFL